jgi:hypothetical protein
VSRVAGLLAIAVLGIVMVGAFSARLNSRLRGLSLPAEVAHEIQANENKLGGVPVPANVDRGTANVIRESVREAFVFGFRTVLLICAGLSVASATISAKMIEDRDR